MSGVSRERLGGKFLYRTQTPTYSLFSYLFATLIYELYLIPSTSNKTAPTIRIRNKQTNKQTIQAKQCCNNLQMGANALAPLIIINADENFILLY